MYLFHVASAHEAYVLSPTDFHNGLQNFSAHPFAPLFDPSHLKATAVITVLVVVSYLLVLLWSATPPAAWLDKQARKAGRIGPFLIRLAISASFFFAASEHAFLGPEITLNSIPHGAIIRILLFVLSGLILFGLFTELAAAVGLAVFIYAGFTYHGYMFTYLNYFGELLVLFLFGTRFVSLDRAFFRFSTWFKSLEKYKWLEVPIVRICYGTALVYAGYTIKFAHQGLTVLVYNQYHLENFFHGTAEFIAAGAGLSEIAIGVFIILGFFQRWTVLISLVFITLSLLFFREMVWPHLMLYGISLSLIVNSKDPFTVDRYLLPWFKKNILGQRV